MFFRFSLRWLLVALGYVCVVSAALANPTVYWLLGVEAATLALLYFAVIQAIVAGRSKRAFWLVFAIVGWGNYITVVDQLQFVPINIGDHLNNTPSLGIFIMKAINDLLPKSVDKPGAYFYLICIDALLIFLGLLGGCLAQYLYDRREP